MTIVVGLSGGVDSSVAALLLKQQGHNVIGLFMKNWEETGADGVCTAEQDFLDVKEVADKIGIPYYSINFSKKYYDNVFRYFLEEYSLGRTPNPDVLCNREIKFKPFLEHALKLGADKIATGHYAGITECDGEFFLTRAVDKSKDQTYFLNQLSSMQLSYSIFPLANLTKKEVRQIAEDNGLANARKKDSTGICFIGERRFRSFLEQYLPNKSGRIKTEDGVDVGAHSGLMYYTLGQRKGLGIGGDSRFDNGRWFVIRKDLDTNTLIVSCGDETPLYKSTLCTSKINWIPSFSYIEKKLDNSFCFECLCQIRYRQPMQRASVRVNADGTTFVSFYEPQRAITAGQYCVFYDESFCLGGGTIEKS